MADAARLQELRAEAAYARQKRDLYRAKSYGGRLTSPQRLRELDRAVEQTAQRLAHAERDAESGAD
jgi:hypothetical protein